MKLPSGAVRYRPEAIDAWLDELARRARPTPRRCHLPDGRPRREATAVGRSPVDYPPPQRPRTEEDHHGR